jgi:hypothetical protein
MTNGALLAYSDRTDSFLPMVCPLGVPHASSVDAVESHETTEEVSKNPELVD